MKKHVNKLMILGLVLLTIGMIYVMHRPVPVRIEARYNQRDVPVLMENEVGHLDSGVEGYEIVAENDFLALYLNPTNTYFAVKDRRNDHTWYSNVTTFDPQARTLSQRNLQRSTLQVSYLQRDNTVATMNNFTFSIDYIRDFDEAFNLIQHEDGFTAVYRIRDREPRGYWFPAYISRERFIELVYNPVQQFGTAFDKRNLDQYYSPLEEDPETFVIRQIRADEETGEFDMNTLSGAQVQTLFKLFYEIGNYGNRVDESGQFIDEYHLDDVAYDNNAYGIYLETRLPEFHVPLRVQLTDDHIAVSVDWDAVVQKHGYSITSIRVLPYFGAVPSHRDEATTEGWMLVPEGSGGLINLNNGKTEPISYSSRIYGPDIREIPTQLPQTDLGARLPIFGMRDGDNAFLAVIDQGSAHALVRADISGKLDGYNRINADFIFRESGSYRLAENQVILWNRQPYTYTPSLKFYFFAEETATLSKMAHLYGQFLAHRYDLELIESHQRRLFVDVLGSYDYDDFFLWFPVTRTGAMTTYAQAQSMVETLQASGVGPITLRYLGWFNGGLEHSIANRISLDRALGSTRDHHRFVAAMQAQDIPVYFDVDFVRAYDSGFFYTTRNYARIIGGQPARYHPYDPASLRPLTQLDPYYLHTVQAIDRNTTSFLQAFTRFDAAGLSLRSLGNTLYGDFNLNQPIARQESLMYHQHILAQLSAVSLMLKSPNDYALPFADVIIDLPTYTSKLVVVDAAVPFYQLAIAPYLSYAMPSYNMYDAYPRDRYFLHALETGSNLKATLSWTNPTVLQHTQFLSFYETYFTTQRETVIEMVEQFAALDLEQAYLVDHVRLSDQVVQVRYSNDRVFLINYGQSPVTIAGINVPANGFAALGVQS